MKVTEALLFISPDELPQLSQELSPRLTMLTGTARGKSAGTPMGTTVWGTRSAQGTRADEAVIWWGWCFTDCGTPCLANPMDIRSNLLFKEDGAVRALPFAEQLLLINKLVYTLPWQEQVLAHVRRLGIARGRTVPSRAHCQPVARSTRGARTAVPQLAAA